MPAPPPAAIRYALYFAPAPEHPLWRAGCAWLGRDPAEPLAPPAPPPPHRAAPWRYGFHATLKPPQRLRDAGDAAALIAAAQALAAAHAPFELPALAVAPLGDFLALRPREPLARGHALWRLADACVQELDAWRAPPDAAEAARRAALRLDEEQRALLARWGYPHVLERWRFHLTLSDHAPPPALAEQARAHFAAALAAPLRCEDLCLFVEPAPGAPFVLSRRFRLGGAGRAAAR